MAQTNTHFLLHSVEEIYAQSVKPIQCIFSFAFAVDSSTYSSIFRNKDEEDDEVLSMMILRDYIAYAKNKYKVDSLPNIIAY